MSSVPPITPPPPPPPVKKRLSQALRKWGVWIGGTVATTGAAMLLDPTINQAVIDTAEKLAGSNPVAKAAILFGVTQAFAAARRKLLAIPEPK